MDSSDQEKVLRHRIRREIMETVLAKRQISPSDMADILRAPLSNVVYHVGVLVDAELLTLANKRRIGGSTEHFYEIAE